MAKPSKKKQPAQEQEGAKRTTAPLTPSMVKEMLEERSPGVVLTTIMARWLTGDISDGEMIQAALAVPLEDDVDKSKPSANSKP